MSSLFRSFSFSSKRSSSSSASTPSNSTLKDEEIKSAKNKSVFEEEISFENINQHVDNWTLPSVAPNSLYTINKDPSWFTKSDYVVRTVEETIPIKQDIEDFYLLSEKMLLKHRKEYNFIHIGCVQIAIKPLIREGLNVSCLVCLLDNRHYDSENAILGAAEAGLHSGPIYFNSFPDRTVHLQDEQLREVLKLKIQLYGLNMKPGSIPATLIYRVQYKVLNSSTTHFIKPTKNGQTTVFLTDQKNATLSIPKVIMWKDVELPESWVMQKVALPKPQPVSQVSRIFQTNDGTVRLSFDRSHRSQISKSESSRYDDFRTANSEASRHSWSSTSKPKLPSVINCPPTPSQIHKQQTNEANNPLSGVDNSSNVPSVHYEDDIKSIESPDNYSSLEEPRDINVIKKDFQIDKPSLQKDFFSLENTLKRKWFFQKFKGSVKEDVQSKFYKFLELVETNIPFFDWFEAYAYDQNLEYPYFKNVDVIKRDWKSSDETISSEFPPSKAIQVPGRLDPNNQPIWACPFKTKQTSEEIHPKDIKGIVEQNNYTNLYLQKIGEHLALAMFPQVSF